MSERVYFLFRRSDWFRYEYVLFFFGLIRVCFRIIYFLGEIFFCVFRIGGRWRVVGRFFIIKRVGLLDGVSRVGRGVEGCRETWF